MCPRISARISQDNIDSLHDQHRWLVHSTVIGAVCGTSDHVGETLNKPLGLPWEPNVSRVNFSAINGIVEQAIRDHPGEVGNASYEYARANAIIHELYHSVSIQDLGDVVIGSHHGQTGMCVMDPRIIADNDRHMLFPVGYCVSWWQPAKHIREIHTALEVAGRRLSGYAADPPMKPMP